MKETQNQGGGSAPVAPEQIASDPLGWAIAHSVADHLQETDGSDATPASVYDALAHREHLDDYFWAAWDHAIQSGADLYRYVASESCR